MRVLQLLTKCGAIHFAPRLRSGHQSGWRVSQRSNSIRENESATRDNAVSGAGVGKSSGLVRLEGWDLLGHVDRATEVGFFDAEDPELVRIAVGDVVVVLNEIIVVGDPEGV